MKQPIAFFEHIYDCPITGFTFFQHLNTDQQKKIRRQKKAKYQAKKKTA